FLAVTLAGTKSNRSAIGARVAVQSAGRRQIDEVMSGGSFYSQNDMSLYFGLGKAAVVERLEVRWPSGTVQEWKDIKVNQRLVITEGSGQLGQVQVVGKK